MKLCSKSSGIRNRISRKKTEEEKKIQKKEYWSNTGVETSHFVDKRSEQ